MENRPKTIEKNRLSHPKFRNLNVSFNQLQSKYDIFKNGTPNVYKQDLQSLKACSVKGNIKNLQIPAIDYLLQQIKNIPQNGGANHRDYNIHPSTIQKYGNKFRNMISDQQQIKDFMNWFHNKQKQILKRNGGASQQFYLYQNLITSAYNEIITQLASISKARSQILRMLWNKQNCQAQKIINIIHKQTSQQEKINLQNVKSLHLSYQDQIISLRSQNHFFEKKMQQATILNQGCINSLRVMRKQKKKYQKIIKQLNQNNYQLKQQCLELLQENINLMMKQKHLPYEKARIFAYHKLHAQKMKKKLHRNKGSKKIFKDVKNKAQHIVQNSQLNDIQQKKQKLVTFLKNRFKQNPNQKNYIMKGELSEDQDEQIKLQKSIQQVIRSKQFKLQVQSRAPKPPNMFRQIGIITDQNQSQILNKKYENMATQTIPCFERQVIDLHRLSEKQQVQGKKKLRDKKVIQRHTLMMIQMNKMMEFKKIDNTNKIRRLSRFSMSINNHQASQRNSRFNSQNGSQLNISQQQQVSDVSNKDIPMPSPSLVTNIRNNRQENIRRTHHESVITQKSAQFQILLKTISAENQQTNKQNKLINQKLQSQKQKQFIQKRQQLPQKKQQTTNSSQQQQIQLLKQLVTKYINKKGPTKQNKNKPQKHLKKILSDTFKNLYVCKKTNFLKQLIRTAKNSYGKIVYQNKLVHLVSMIIEHREVSLLSALSILINIYPNLPVNQIAYSCPYSASQAHPNSINYSCIINTDLFFNLNIKNPTEIQFNIWNNYTNTQKLNNHSFIDILKIYFNDNKCMYLQLKIKQFIGFNPITSTPPNSHTNTQNIQSMSLNNTSNSNYNINNNYYIQLNPLLMYIMEVYLTEKKNYYESYSQVIDFLSDGAYLDLHAFVFLLDLLCFGEEEQKYIIQTYFGSCYDGNQQTINLLTNSYINNPKSNPNQNNLHMSTNTVTNKKHLFCPKDIFYRICIKYQLPLFQFIKILKLEQFKNLHEYVQTDYIDISDIQKWNKIKQSLQRKLKIKNKYGFGLIKVIEKLDQYMRMQGNLGKVQSQAFLFYYRIILYAVFSDSNKDKKIL